MEGENKKTIKYLMNQPATVHNYGKLSKSESPRTHSSPTSILRKFPHSLRHDQKHQTKIKRNSSPVSIIISELSPGDRDQWGTNNRKSWSIGDNGSDESEERPSSDGSGKLKNYNFDDSISGRKSSETSIESDFSSDSEIWKLQPAISNANNRNFVREIKAEKSVSQESHPELKVSNDSKGEATAGSVKKLSVINENSLMNKWKKGDEDEFRGTSAKEWSVLGGGMQFPTHKSTPNLIRDSNSHPERAMADSFDGKLNSKSAKERRIRLRRVSDSLPQLDRRNRIVGSILPEINRTISESLESSPDLRKCGSTEEALNGTGSGTRTDSSSGISQREPYSNLFSEFDGKTESIRSDSEEGEGINLIGNGKNAIVRSGKDQKEAKNRRANRKAIEMMPNLRNLIGKRIKGESADGGESPPASGSSVPLGAHPVGKSDSLSSLNVPQINYLDADKEDSSMKKCQTVYALTSLIRAESPFHLEPIKPVNRLRVPPNGFSGSTSRMCSRCSSLLSMASSSRYSINTTGSGFVNCGSNPSAEKSPEPLLLCKLCLTEVPVSMSLKINCCGCVFCKDCMRLYVEFEIQEGAYDISCPDAQCNKQGIVSTSEVETLVMPRMMERYRRFRLNHEVDMDRNRTWCPRAGCETVCDICPREKCAPTSVHCPTCDSDFCSNCKNPWHGGLTCEENSKKLAKEGRTDFMEPGIPFDSDLIKCCPMCSVPIEKDEGCAQMMCKRCKHVFCWYCLASLDDDFLLRHYDKGPCKNKLGHTRASVIWHRTQVIGIFAGLGLLLLVASPLLLLAAPCIVCCKCRVCNGTKLDAEDDLPEESGT